MPAKNAPQAYQINGINPKTQIPQNRPFLSPSAAENTPSDPENAAQKVTNHHPLCELSNFVGILCIYASTFAPALAGQRITQESTSGAPPLPASRSAIIAS